MSMRLYWGDIHNHNEIGYGQGSLERSYEIARTHLDFYAFTPHGIHADGGVLEGYPVVRRHWQALQQAAAAWNAPGQFTCFLAYEWHSNTWGHVHVVHLEREEAEMCSAPTLVQLQDCYRDSDAILVPHHTAYKDGVDWELFDEGLSPLVEIFSEHGCSERDSGPFPMTGHSGGPGDFRFTAQHGLALGKRFGFTAGTDNHDGYPGAYGLGLTGVLATDNSRAAIAAALRQRRTLAVTGDRIGVDFAAGDQPLGSVLPLEDGRRLRFAVESWDLLHTVELVCENAPVQTWRPDYATPLPGGEGRFRLRIEYGWGPMRGFQLFDWEGVLRIEGGRLREVVPCFTSDPFDETRRKQVLERDETAVRWRSHTSRGGLFISRNGLPTSRANDALCLEIEGTPQTRLALEMGCQTHRSLMATAPDWALSPRLGQGAWSIGLDELLEGRRGFRLEEIPTSVVVHRAVPEHGFTLEGDWEAERPACYYLRVVQENGQMAWTSPVWLE